MYDLEYASSGTYCLDNTYDDANPNGYFGYFDQGSIYTYDNNKFTSGGTLSGCTYQTGFVCVHMTGTAPNRTVDKFAASGKFLNWLSASKFDVQKKILTGGKYDSTNQLFGESRGCVGRRFIKLVPAIAGTTGNNCTSGLTFAIRGPYAQEPDNLNQQTQGGQTRIEIYEGCAYNSDACTTAVQNWSGSNLGQWDTAAVNCFGLGAGNSPTGRELATFTESVKDCFDIKENIRNGLTAPDSNNLFKNVTINNLKTQCGNVFSHDCPSGDISTCATVNTETSGNWICSAEATHLAPAGYYAILGSNLQGFLGKCWKDNANAWPPSNDCVYEELLHFCNGYSTTEVIDPTQAPGGVSTAGNVPAIIMDAGARTLGDPAGTFFVKVAAATPPTGLIQDFAVTSQLIRFGAMSFNCIGSASETTVPGSCLTGATNLDAGKIIAPIKGTCLGTTTPCVFNSECTNGQCDVPVGDHNSGLIGAIDGLQAISWTPFAEAFYNAVAYYAKDATATNSSLDSTAFTAAASAIASPIQLPSPTDSYTNVNPIQYRCQKNNVLLITDGSSTADLNSTMTGKVTAGGTFRDPNTTSEPGACGSFSGSPYLHDLSYYAYHRNIFNPDTQCVTSAGVPTTNCYNAQSISTYVVYTGPTTTSTDVCDSYHEMYLTAQNGGTTLKQASNPTALEDALRQSFLEIAGTAASGTAASVLATGEGSGANLVQAIFYPKTTIGGTQVQWVGFLQKPLVLHRPAS